jgi:hypothetical protein
MDVETQEDHFEREVSLLDCIRLIHEEQKNDKEHFYQNCSFKDYMGIFFNH